LLKNYLNIFLENNLDTNLIANWQLIFKNYWKGEYFQQNYISYFTMPSEEEIEGEVLVNKFCLKILGYIIAVPLNNK